MDGLHLIIRSYADMTMDRALAVARVFDAHPGLRPLKVGGDPARRRVEPSLEAIVADQGLPVEWLTVRRDGRWPDFEGGQIDLLPGRGSWLGTPPEWAEPSEIGGPHHVGRFVYSLTGHKVEQHWLASTMREPGAVTDVAAMFEELVVALDAAYGYVVAESHRPDGLPSVIDRQLPGIFWLNYFGPAFLTARPELAQAFGARRVTGGGVLVRTTDLPWPETATDDGAGELRRLFGEEPFAFVRPRNPALPSIQEHLAASPGTMEMPWVTHLRSKAVDSRAKKYAAARRRLAAALDAREEPPLTTEAVEWSTSFDRHDFLEFHAFVKRRLGGELSRPLGTALRDVVANAPLQDEDGVVLETRLGAVRLGWFADDVDTVDLYVSGPAAVRDVCDSWLTP